MPPFSSQVLVADRIEDQVEERLKIRLDFVVLVANQNKVFYWIDSRRHVLVALGLCRRGDQQDLVMNDIFQLQFVKQQAQGRSETDSGQVLCDRTSGSIPASFNAASSSWTSIWCRFFNCSTTFLSGVFSHAISVGDCKAVLIFDFGRRILRADDGLGFMGRRHFRRQDTNIRFRLLPDTYRGG